MIAGYDVENVRSDERGQIDIARLKEIVNRDVAGMMVTNPSTLGVFEQNIAEAAKILHDHGALLYMDGANMNALAGVARPGDFGVDVMHLNLHKTFSTPHGGGGWRPVGGGEQHLEPFLPIPRLARVGDLWTWNYDRPIRRPVQRSTGTSGVLVRALAYIMAHGGNACRAPPIAAQRQSSANCWNLLRHALSRASMHECVFSVHGIETRRRYHEHRQEAPDRLRLPSLHEWRFR